MADDNTSATEEAGATPPELPAPGKKRSRALVIVIPVVLFVVIGAAAAFLLWPKGEPAEPVAAGEGGEQQIGPRTIFESVATLQRSYKLAHNDHAKSITALLEHYQADPKGITPRMVEVLKAHAEAGELITRSIQGGFEAALRKDKQWLIYSWTGTGAPRISTVSADSGPPFPVSSDGDDAPVAEAPKQELVEFADPRDYFQLMLPPGFTSEDLSKGTGTRITFTYTNSVRMTIQAMETKRAWDPAAELSAKAEQIRSGAVAAFADFALAVTNMVNVEGATGYEIGLMGIGAKAAVKTHSFVFGKEGMAVSVALMCNSASGHPLHDALVGTVKDTFRMGEGPEAARQMALKPPPPPKEEPKPPPSEEEEKKALSAEEMAAWDEARATIKTAGIMKSGQAYVALVNDRLVHVNETVTVSLKTKTYRFIVKEITVDNVVFEPMPETKAGDATRVRF